MAVHRIPAQVPRVGTVFSILFTDQSVRSYRDTLRADTGKRNALDMGLLRRGIFVKPGKPFYLSTAHDQQAIRETLAAFEEAVRELT